MSLLVLIGPPGAGKSTVATRLGRRLDLPVLDTDHMVEERAGCSISDLFVDHGEAHFRALEADAVAEALTASDAVVSVGGGAPMTPACAEQIRAAGTRGAVIFLDVDIADAAHRVGFDQSRPLLAVNPRGTWVRLMRERRPTYASLATLTVHTGGRRPRAIVDDIVAALGVDR